MVPEEENDGLLDAERHQARHTIAPRAQLFPVAEKFVSVNGEGLAAGRPAAFIRFAGCNMWCTYCDTRWANHPLVEVEDTLPFLQTIPAGTYPVKICVVPSEQYGDRYACVKVEVSQEKPVRYELGMVGNENLDAALGDDDYFGFGVDAGMGCIADIQTQAAFKTYWAKRLEEDPDIDPYNDLFCDLLEENAQAHPKYQGDCGDWLNWTVPDTDCNLPIFSSGWGDGYYPVYFGYDAKGKVCAVYVRFIDIEASYKEQE